MLGTADQGDTTGAVNGDTGMAAARYATGFSDREPYLIRARRISKLTIGSLFRQWGATGATDTVLPWQSLGAYGVNNLAAKLVLAMFPPGISPVKMAAKDSSQDAQIKLLGAILDKHGIDRASVADLLQQQSSMEAVLGQVKAWTDKFLSKQEQAFADNVEEDGDRAAMFDTARHMIVGGSHCLHICNNAQLQSIPLERFVCWRDRSGNLTEFCVEQPMAYEELEPDVQAICRDRGYGPTDKDPLNEDDRGKVNWGTNNPLWAPIKVYTHGKREGPDTWCVYDEVLSVHIPGSTMRYKEACLPWLFLRMVALKDEPYGRSYCEDYEADLQTYDAIWQALTEGGAILARIITLITPGSSTNKDAYAKAPNGSVITGAANEVTVVQANKGADIEIIYKEAEKVESRIERLFILNSAIERPGERVTATEVTFKARELDTTLGGVYSNQVTTWQKPWAEVKIQVYVRKGRMVNLGANTTKITVVTGDAALGRLQRAQGLEEFLQTMATIFTPEGMAPYISITNALERSAANRAIDSDGLVKSDKEVQAAAAAKQQQQLSQQVAPNVVDQAGQMLQNNQNNAATAAQASPQGAPQPSQPQDQQGAPA